MQKILLPQNKKPTIQEITTILGRTPTFHSIFGNTLELPDDITPTEIQNITNSLYPDETTFNNGTIADKLALIAKRLGITK